MTANENHSSLPASAVALLRVLSMLDGTSITEDLLLTGAENVILTDYPKTLDVYKEAREALVKSSLVQKDSKLKAVKTHYSVQLAVRDDLKGGRLSLRLAFESAVALLAEALSFSESTSLYSKDRLRKVRDQLPHINVLVRLLDLVPSGPSRTHPWVPGPKFSALINEVAWYEITSLNSNHLILVLKFAELSKRLLDDASRRPTPDSNIDFDKLRLDCYRNLALISIYKNEQGASDSCQTWITALVKCIQRSQDPTIVKMLPMAYNAMGSALMKHTQNDKAMELWLLSCENIEGQDESQTLPFLFPWINRALVAAFSGDAAKGLSIMLPVLQKREVQLGANDTSTLESGLMLSCMGVIHHMLGHQNQAFDFNERAVSVLTEVVGQHSRWTAKATYRLACDHFVKGNLETAEMLLRRCRLSLMGVDWAEPEAVRTTWKLGRVLKAKGSAEHNSEVETLFNDAMYFRRYTLDLSAVGKEEELTDADWDDLVFYLFR